MRSRASRRNLLLFFAMAVAFALVASDHWPRSGKARLVVERTSHPVESLDRARPETGSSDSKIPALVPRTVLIPTASRGDARDLFAYRDWTPPPAPAPTAPSPTAEASPPDAVWPYVLLGKIHDDRGWQVFLGHGETTVFARAGDMAGDGFRIDSIQPPRMEVTYLPLGQSLHIPIGEGN